MRGVLQANRTALVCSVLRLTAVRKMGDGRRADGQVKFAE